MWQLEIAEQANQNGIEKADDDINEDEEEQYQDETDDDNDGLELCALLTLLQSIVRKQKTMVSSIMNFIIGQSRLLRTLKKNQSI